MLYGSRYTEKDKDSAAMPDYGYHNGSLYAGYAYADARSSFSLLPYFEYDFRNRHTHYRAWGADADWSRTLSPRWRVNARAGAKKTGYGGQSKTYFADYKQYELGAGAEFPLRRKAAYLPTSMPPAKPIPKNPLPAKNIRHGWARIGFFRAVLI